MATSSPVAPRLSAAIMLMRSNTMDGSLEVYMVRRHAQSSFAPDVFVFPGGSVVDSDREAEVTAGVCVPINAPNTATALGAGVRVAGIRELFEEAGVLLALRDEAISGDNRSYVARLATYRQQLQRDEVTIAEIAAAEDIVLATDGLLPCAHWITPEAFPKRFATHFFLALHPHGQEASYDALETTGGLWIRPTAALAGADAGNFPLVFATVHQLRDLALFTTPGAALDAWRGRTPPTIMPRALQRDGREVILMPDEFAP